MPDKSLHRTTYADFYRRSRLLAEALQKAGLKKGERVATLMWNHYAHFEAYFGVIASAGVMHTLNLRLAPDDIGFIANHAEDRFIIVDDVLLPLFEQFKAQTKIEKVIVVAADRQAGAGGLRRLRGVPEDSERTTGTTPKCTRTIPSPCATPRAPRAGPRASCIPTARRCCTRSCR